ncbi:hypothetical protein GCM10009551_028940 [Nocardiopsis tropica]
MSRGVNTVSSGRRPFFASAAGPVLISFSLLTCSCSFPGEAGGAEEVSEPSAVASVSGIGWEWEAPEGRTIERVEPVPTGAAVVLDTGIVVLHGQNGEEVWSRLAAEGERFTTTRTVDGSAFLVAHGAEDAEVPEESLVLDAATGAEEGEFQVLEEAAPWGLWRVSRDERVSRPARESESFRPISVAEVGSGELRWEQEEPLECEAAPGLPAQQVDALLHESVLAVLVTCSPERFEESMEVTTAVVGLDLADGGELWREEFTHEASSPFPAASVSLDGDMIVLQGVELPEAHVLNASDGDVVASTPQNVAGVFDGSVLAWDASAGGRRYDLLGMDLETAESVELSERSGGSLLSEEDVLPLGDGLVSVEVLEEDGAASGLALGFTPWGGAETEVLDPGFPIEAGDYFDRFTGQVVEVPGAVVLVDGRSPEPTQLVAYQ